MQPQVLLSLIVFANIFHAFALPIQHTDVRELEARLEINDVSLLSRNYFKFDERDLDQPQLLRRQIRPNAHHTLVYAKKMAAATVNKPASNAVFSHAQWRRVYSDFICATEPSCLIFCSSAHGGPYSTSSREFPSTHPDWNKSPSNTWFSYHSCGHQISSCFPKFRFQTSKDFKFTASGTTNPWF